MLKQEARVVENTFLLTSLWILNEFNFSSQGTIFQKHFKQAILRPELSKAFPLKKLRLFLKQDTAYYPSHSHRLLTPVKRQNRVWLKCVHRIVPLQRRAGKSDLYQVTSLLRKASVINPYSNHLLYSAGKFTAGKHGWKHLSPHLKGRKLPGQKERFTRQILSDRLASKHTRFFTFVFVNASLCNNHPKAPFPPHLRKIDPLATNLSQTT